MDNLASYVEQAAEEFVKEDNPIVDGYFDKFLGDLKLSDEEERDKFRNMVFDKDEQLTKAKKIIEELYNIIPASMADYAKEPMEHARKFMTEE